ncbi:ABC transporter permease subunit [Streptomyces rhizosphaericus]|uniref:ABC transporter permease subunit n=1 Tax=Streptomyces rhizosphaericus TaxID=114699 RepID=UPI0020309386|nr:hypothetical protein [Streptomyces rhizosphaericus]
MPEPVRDQTAVLGPLALGMTAVIVMGGIDLSVGAVLALAAMVVGWLSHNEGWPLWLSAVVAIGVAGACGLANGLGVTYTKLPPFIATLAMMSIARGLANVITDGQQIVGFPDWFDNLSTSRYLGIFTASTAVLAALYVAGWAYMRYRSGGRALYAIGGSAEVARLAGINVKRRTVLVYTVTGVLAGLAGVFPATPRNRRAEVAERVARFEADTPLGRMATVDEMVGPTVFLLSDAASFVTGVDCWSTGASPAGRPLRRGDTARVRARVRPVAAGSVPVRSPPGGGPGSRW